MNRHLRASQRSRTALCGETSGYFDSVRERTWVTCIKCQRIIASYHPNKQPSELFKHSRI